MSLLLFSAMADIGYLFTRTCDHSHWPLLKQLDS